ncbi:PDZ domain-containing protein, partial [archaeon]
MVCEEAIQVKIWKDVRFITLVALLLLSAYFVLSPMVFKKTGVAVSFVNANADCAGLKAEDVITQVNGYHITDSTSFDQSISDVKAGDFVTLLSNNVPASCTATSDRDIGFTVRDLSATNLKFGIEIEGGTRVLLTPSTSNVTAAQIDETARILGERVNLFGLSDIRVTPIGSNLIQLEASGLSGGDIQNFLAKQGRFDGKLAEPLEFTDNNANIIVGGTSYPVTLVGSQLDVNGSLHSINSTFALGGINFQITNITNNSAIVLANIFSGNDITNVLTDPQHSGITPANSGYKFTFTVQVSKESADRFAKATEGQPASFSNGESYITPQLVLFLDEQPVSSLNIVSTLAGQSLTTPSIQGFKTTRDEAQNEMLRLETILRSGSLPVKLNIERVDTITQSEGSGLINST